MGMVVTDFLDSHFPNIMNYNFTAQAEEALDDIAEGDIEWQKMIGQFYSPFHDNIEKTLKNSERNTGAEFWERTRSAAKRYLYGSDGSGLWHK